MTEYLHRLGWNDRLAVATSFGQIRNDRILSKFVYCFDEANNIQTYPLKVFMRKGFPYQVELNKFIQHISENGLIMKWYKKHKFGPFVEKPPSFQFIEITIEMYLVLGSFIIGALLGFVIILFVERMTYKKARSQGAIWLWRYIEMMIDPYRYFLLKDLSY